MNLLKPWLWYLTSALIMCIVYCGIEKANNSLGTTAKCILCSWSIISLVVTSALFGLQTYIDEIGFPPLQVSGVAVGASLITLCLSSSCVYSAM